MRAHKNITSRQGQPKESERERYQQRNHTGTTHSWNHCVFTRGCEQSWKKESCVMWSNQVKQCDRTKRKEREIVRVRGKYPKATTTHIFPRSHTTKSMLRRKNQQGERSQAKMWVGGWRCQVLLSGTFCSLLSRSKLHRDALQISAQLDFRKQRARVQRSRIRLVSPLASPRFHSFCRLHFIYFFDGMAELNSRLKKKTVLFRVAQLS